eukprot:NODE_4458_length_781_cov_87.992355_g4435_i0.p2 GENE.NODE_4458_length_781_cov_87.992355_g4435_i0~~NODE_4458_length_781_cov_87.992355_g4435_i0.p2  ORF type:complete len:214 (+),score=50.09 NODE_4458_length_781_cov_87.992355_g4435_i0:73-714(+)
MPQKVSTAADFQSLVSGNKTVCVHFAADWCEPCPALNQALDGLQDSYKTVQFAQVNAEELSDLTEKYNVENVPHLLVFHEGTVKAEVQGAKLDELKEQLSTLTGTLHDASVPLNDRLKTLINQKQVMLFMKGTPDAPRCGFSRTTVGMLNETEVPYGTFDILGNEEVRQGLKTYSNWPTYPQLYVKGELVGGLDILKELKESGDLVSTLKGEA